jgi:hypothetical protein
MTNLAKQIRELSDRLVAINERGEDLDVQHNEPPLKIGDIDPRNGQKILSAATDGSGNVIRSRFGDIYNVKYAPTDWAKPPEPPKPDPVVVPEPPKPDPVVIPKPPVPDIIAPMPSPDPEPPKPDEPCGPELKAKLRLMPSFNKAYSAAKQGGCSDFEWCQIIDVPNIAPMPKQDKPVGIPIAPYVPGITGGKGGDMPNISQSQADALSLAAAGGMGAESIHYQQTMLENEELNRWRKIAGLKEAVVDPSAPHLDASGQLASGGVTKSTTDPVAPASSGDLPEIKAGSKSAAIAQARKKGIKRFRWCSMYKVTDKKNIAPMPKQDKPVGIPIAPYVPGITGGKGGDMPNISQSQADALSLAAAGGMGA